MAVWLTCPLRLTPCPHTGNPCRFGLCLIRDGEPSRAPLDIPAPPNTDLGRLGRMAAPHVPAPLPSGVRWLVMALMVAASLGFIAATFLMVRG